MIMYRMYLLCFVSLIVEVSAFSTHSILKPPRVPDYATLPTAQWFDQKLDHFGHAVGTWKQRYFVNDTYWAKDGGPVFLMLGGEGEASPAWIYADTDVMKNAAKYNAFVVLLEHRYYGASHPTTDLSTANLAYLSSRQALADVQTLKSIIVAKYNMTTNNRWISFGGSYSGALSAWLRLLYPLVVSGAVATSAPVLAKVNFYEYAEVAGQSLASSESGVSCAEAVNSASMHLDTLLQNKSYWSGIESMFNISPPLQDVLDITQVAQNLANNFMGVVQYNKDNTAFEGRANNMTIDDLCAVMTNESIGDAIHRYAAVNKMMLQDSKLDCSYRNMLEELSMMSWNSSSAEGGRQWIYQTCTEFGYYQTSDSANQPFGDLISLASFTEVCRILFNISQDQLLELVDMTNKLYGGKNISSTNIVFPNGSIDPWHALGITKDIGPTLKAIFIQGTAHCANMYPATPSDPDSLKEARDEITHIIGTWLAS